MQAWLIAGMVYICHSYCWQDVMMPVGPRISAAHSTIRDISPILLLAEIGWQRLRTCWMPGMGFCWWSSRWWWYKARNFTHVASHRYIAAKVEGTLAASTLARAASRAWLSPARMAAPLARRALISSETSRFLSSSGRSGLLHRHSLFRTTKYLPSGVFGYRLILCGSLQL